MAGVALAPPGGQPPLALRVMSEGLYGSSTTSFEAALELEADVSERFLGPLDDPIVVLFLEPFRRLVL